MIRALLRLYDPYLRHLEAEVEWYRVQLAHERRRAEQAVDMLLQMSGKPPVTPPAPRAERDAMEQEITRVLESAEFQGVGSVE